MGEGNCCNKCHSFIVILLLALSTFFLGGIWGTLKHGCSSGAASKICPMTGQMMSPEKMMCPLTGKPVEPVVETGAPAN